MEVPTKMRAARIHEVGAPFIVEEVPTPRPAPDEVLVRVRSCGIVPNLTNVLSKGGPWYPQFPMSSLPAIFGLDPAGEVAQVGEHVFDFKVGDRVYVNPGRSCGTCDDCVAGDRISCRYFTLNGYFGFSEHSAKMFERYPYAGFGQYMNAPVSALVKIADAMSFDQAARFGYVGTAYSGLKKAQLRPTSTLLINGASGTLGVGGVICALAMGVRKILATGRDRDMLDAVKAIAPDRIEVFSFKDGSITDWVMSQTAGDGVNAVLDCLARGAAQESFLEGLHSLRRGGVIVDIGGVNEVPVKLYYLRAANRHYFGSLWFSTEECRELAAMVETGALDMSVFEHHGHPLDDINEAIASMAARKGGFSNFVIHP